MFVSEQIAVNAENVLLVKSCIQRVHSKTLDHIVLCYDEDGQHMVDIIFKTWNSTYFPTNNYT